MKADRILEILACPRCRGDVEVEQRRRRITCKECWTVYPMEGMVPIMLPDPEAPPRREGAPEANPYAPGSRELIERHPDGLVLDDGAGCNKQRFPHVVQLDNYLSPSTDIVGDALQLPFKEGSFDAVISEAVLEHVTHPFRYVQEIHRVLKEGGEVRVDVNFLSPYHAMPGHYFNVTREGIEELLGSFEKIQSGVGPHQEPWITLRDVLGSFAEALSNDSLRDRFFNVTVGDLLRTVRAEKEIAWLRNLDKEKMEIVAAGVYYHGLKPSMAAPRRGEEKPRVSIIVTNPNGAKGLGECLESITAQDYPKDRIDVILVEPESKGGSVEQIRRRFPRVSFVEAPAGAGTAEARMIGASRAAGDYLGFLDGSCRIGEKWILGMLEPMDRGEKILCTASPVLDGKGRVVRALPGLMDLLGHPLQGDRGKNGKDLPSGPALFPLASGMLIQREVFHGTGGFDTDFFSTLEDLDLGWRLWVLGYQVHHAPKAPVRQRAAKEAMSPERRVLLSERNALAAIYKNYEEKNLQRILPVAILLALQRGWSHSTIGTRRFLYGAPDEKDSEPEKVSRVHTAHILAVDEFRKGIDGIHTKRLVIQKGRARTDEEILALLPPRDKGEGEYAKSQAALLEAFGLASLGSESKEEDR